MPDETLKNTIEALLRAPAEIKNKLPGALEQIETDGIERA
jgi:hypothetical protein